MGKTNQVKTADKRSKTPETFDLGSLRWIPYPLSVKGSRSDIILSTVNNFSFIKSIPFGQGKKVIKTLAQTIVSASVENRSIIWALGADIVRAGVSPLILDLMDHNMINGICLDGDAARYDTEMGRFGRALTLKQESTSDSGLWKELGELWAEAAQRGHERGSGFGRALGDLILRLKNKKSDKSILAEAARRGMPATVHFVPGSVGPELHPDFSASDFGVASQIDFKILMKASLGLSEGVWVQAGEFAPLGKLFCRMMLLMKHLKITPEKITYAVLGSEPEGSVNVEIKNCLEMGRYPQHKLNLLPGHFEFTVPLLRAFLLKECSFADKFRDL